MKALALSVFAALAALALPAHAEKPKQQQVDDEDPLSAPKTADKKKAKVEYVEDTADTKKKDKTDKPKKSTKPEYVEDGAKAKKDEPKADDKKAAKKDEPKADDKKAAKKDEPKADDKKPTKKADDKKAAKTDKAKSDESAAAKTDKKTDDPKTDRAKKAKADDAPATAKRARSDDVAKKQKAEEDELAKQRKQDEELARLLKQEAEEKALAAKKAKKPAADDKKPKKANPDEPAVAAKKPKLDEAPAVADDKKADKKAKKAKADEPAISVKATVKPKLDDDAKTSAKSAVKKGKDDKKAKDPDEIELDPVVMSDPPPTATASATASASVTVRHRDATKGMKRLYVRAGVAHVAPLADSREMELADVDGAASLAVQNGPIAGSGASVSSATIPALILGYKLTPRVSLETILGVPFTVKFKATGTLANESIAPMALGIPTGVPALGPELGEAKAAPPTVTMTYALGKGPFVPYVGAGLAVLFAFDAKVTNTLLTEVSQPEFTVKPAPGLVLQAGGEAKLWKNIYARLDVKFIAGMLAQAEAKHIQVRTPELPLFDTVEVGTARMSVWVNPLIIQAGIGTDF